MDPKYFFNRSSLFYSFGHSFALACFHIHLLFKTLYCIYCLENFESERESMFQTNSSRKKRKPDAEESDDDGYGKGKTVKEVEGKNFELQKEEFPKGKRKARKRRRLALQGRAVKDVRRRQKADLLTDEDVGPFSNSSEESMFSEDEIQVGRICPAGSSSDEAGSA